MGSKCKSFVFYEDWWLAIKDLPKDVRGEVCEGIIRYAFGETETGLKSLAEMALKFIRPQIDRDKERYQTTVERRREAGQRGANARWGDGGLRMANDGKNGICHKAIANDGYNVNDNDNVNDNNNSLSLSLSPLESSEKEEEEKGGVTAAERERFYEVFYFRNLKNPSGEVDRFVDYYEANGWCRSTGQKPVKNRISLARAWKASSDQPRVDLTALKWLEAVYAHLKAEDKEAASAIIHGGVSNMTIELIDVNRRRLRVFCESSEIYKSIERVRAAGVTNPSGVSEVTYRVKSSS